jgi:nucleotide-binding universal stress UspA family protein
MPFNFSTIMVPLDGSALAEQAVPVAARLARSAKGTLHFVTAHRLGMGWGDVDDGVANASLDAIARQQELAYLHDTATRMASLDLKTRVTLCDGPVAQGLARYGESNGIDVIVMTTHGRGGFSRLWLGSVAESLVRMATVPVLCLKASHTGAAGGQEMTVGEVLIPLDGSDGAEAALEPAVALAKEWQAEITLLRVVSPVVLVWTGATEVPVMTIPDDVPVRRLEAYRYLKQLRVRLQEEGLQVHAEVVVHEHPATAVIDRVNQREGTAVALATHRHNRLERVLLGSVADKILRSASGPVLVCHTPT